jgi:hypothetical protein
VKHLGETNLTTFFLSAMNMNIRTPTTHAAISARGILKKTGQLPVHLWKACTVFNVSSLVAVLCHHEGTLLISVQCEHKTYTD